MGDAIISVDTSGLRKLVADIMGIDPSLVTDSVRAMEDLVSDALPAPRPASVRRLDSWSASA